MGLIGNEVRQAMNISSVGILKAGYYEEFSDGDERLAVILADAIRGFADGGATIDEFERIAVSLAAGLRELGIRFEDE